MIVNDLYKFMANCVFFFLLKTALEEKKSARIESKKSEKMAMQNVQEKSATLEIYNKVFWFHSSLEHGSSRSYFVYANWPQQVISVLTKGKW